LVMMQRWACDDLFIMMKTTFAWLLRSCICA